MEDKEEMTSLVTALNKLHKDGYKIDFKVTDDGRLATMDDKESFSPDQVRIVDFYRFEGESSPDDMAILYVLETTTGAKGSISDSYGAYSNESIETFMKKVEDLGMDLDKGKR